MVTVRKFNTEGPVVAADHYHIPPLERIDLDAVLGLIRDKKYFVLHAPRQTGKTSALLALRDLLNNGGHGEFRCVYANVEGGQAMRENVAEGMRTVLAELAFEASVIRSLHERSGWRCWWTSTTSRSWTRWRRRRLPVPTATTCAACTG